jgi:calcium/calmodulin-dependent protein kinase kinase 2
MNSFASDCEQPGHAGDITKKEAEAGILPSHGMKDFGTWPPTSSV